MLSVTVSTVQPTPSSSHRNRVPAGARVPRAKTSAHTVTSTTGYARLTSRGKPWPPLA